MSGKVSIYLGQWRLHISNSNYDTLFPVLSGQVWSPFRQRHPTDRQKVKRGRLRTHVTLIGDYME